MAISNRSRKVLGMQERGEDELDMKARALGLNASVVKTDESHFSKAEKMMLQSKSLTTEDDPWTFLSNERKENLIAPTYDPVTLSYLPHSNNTLLQLIEAMEVNIDGTGHDFERRDGEVKTDEEKKSELGDLYSFFDAVFPGQSFVKLRRSIRRDLETVGHAYMEVIRDSAGKIALLNWLDAKLVRMIRLDDPVAVTKTVVRGGEPVELQIFMRERRFAQILGHKVRYFREFGSSRDIDANRGVWLDKITGEPEELTQEELEGKKSTVEKLGKQDLRPTDGEIDENQPVEKGNEVIQFILKPDVLTPYGVPRWINQIPSVLGSRGAEELNLEYFRSGGLPPVMIMIQGGQLSTKSRADLNSYLSGTAKSKVRAVIAEIFSTGGDLSSAGAVKVNVERFGSDRQADSMFEGYDTKCSERLRSSFRLPGMFTGNTQDYNFATAYAAYLVAEAQVFKPERALFDEVINSTIMVELAPEYYFRSLPMTIHDVNVQLAAMGLVKDITDQEEFLDEVNELAGLNLTFQEPPDPMELFAMETEIKAKAGVGAGGNGKSPFPPKGGGKGGKPFGNKKVGTPKNEGVGGKEEMTKKTETDGRGVISKMDNGLLLDLAEDWSAYLAGERRFEKSSIGLMTSVVNSFEPPLRKLFNAYVGMKMAPGAKHDPEGVSELVACAGELVSRKDTH